MHKYGPPGRLTLPEMHKAGQRPVFFITFIILSVIFLFFKKDSHVAIFISLLLLTQRILRITEENFRHFIHQLKVREEGREGEPGTVRVSPANKILFPFTCHRRLAGRDPTARRWSPKAKCFKAGQTTGAPCACKRTYTERCKSASYEHGQYVAEPNCVAKRRGGEQGDAKWQSAGYELDSA